MKKLTNILACALIVFLMVPLSAQAAKLVPGGQLIGLEMGNDTVTVVAFDEPQSAAQDAGLQVGDQITYINDTPIHSAADIRGALTRSNGTVKLCFLRKGKEKSLELAPQITENGPRLGVYLKQGITGVGTVTYFDPDTGKFGALGHGVNDATGKILEMAQGKAYTAGILNIKKGRSGNPGQLMGAMNIDQCFGNLCKNTAQGVFGITDFPVSGTPISTATAGEVHTGDAIIRSTIESNKVQEYSVNILKIYPSSRSGGRNMLLKVTDPALLQATGGIVQGMSGSPIIQDGKLVGAVTHVLVNDPTTGYGIFIDNMLDAAA